MSLFLTFVVAFFVSSASARPLLLAHRGSPEFFPEHTFPGYQLASTENCDFIEIDVQSTRDHELIIVHSPDLSEITDVANRPEFAHKRSENVNIGGELHSGWLVPSFDLSEIRQLKVHERFSWRNHDLDGYFGIMTLQEFLEWIQVLSTRGIYVNVCFEIKYPSFFRAIGLPIEEPLTDLLAYYEFFNETLTDPQLHSHTIIESFEFGGVKRLRELILKQGPKVVDHRFSFYQLVDSNFSLIMNDTSLPYGWYVSSPGLRWLKEEGFKGVAVGGKAVNKALVQDIHQSSMEIFMYTLRTDLGVRRSDGGRRGILNIEDRITETETPEERFTRFLVEYQIDGAFVEDLLLANVVLADDSKKPNYEWVALAIGLPLVLCAACLIIVCVAVLFRRMGKMKQKEEEEERGGLTGSGERRKGHEGALASESLRGMRRDKFYSVLEEDGN